MVHHVIIDPDRIKQLLGRAPNKEEVTFLSQFIPSVQSTLKWERELDLLSLENEGPDTSVILTGENRGDPFKSNGMLVCLARGYSKVFSIKTQEGTMVAGIRKFPEKKASFSDQNTILFFPKNRRLVPFIRSIDSHPNLLGLRPVFSSGFPAVIYRLINIIPPEKGICLHGFEDQSAFFRHTQAGILVFVTGGSEQDFLKKGNLNGCPGQLIGHLTGEGVLIFRSKSAKAVRIPVGVLKTLMAEKNRQQSPSKTSHPTTHREKTGFSTYGKAVIALVRFIARQKEPEVKPGKYWSHSGVVFSSWNRDHILVVALNTNHHLEIPDWGIRGMAVLSNAARRLVCRGVEPETATALIQAPHPTPELTEYLQGLVKAAQHLNLVLSHSVIANASGELTGRIAAGGVCKGSCLFPQTFQQPGDFISILGSHRGELGGSLFSRYFSKTVPGGHPILDLNMESRVQETILTGIQAGLIQSARAISGGGLAVAIARSLVTDNEQMGARIHFSRKLSSEELLFGESQGLILISIREDDLMEFERICMNIGVPSTTIGRVTDEGMFTFNDIVKLTTKELHSE